MFGRGATSERSTEGIVFETSETRASSIAAAGA
jgi:hypothetical protein